MSPTKFDPDNESTHQPYAGARVRILGAQATKVPRPTPAPGRLTAPIVSTGEYTVSDWEAESYAVFAEGGDPLPCPECGRTGFYGPRFVEPDQKIRACRFCGFWQLAGEAPQQFVPTAHDCDEWPECSRAPYIWWTAADTESYTCPYCKGTVTVAGATISVPNDVPNHPWWKIPQGRTQSFYQRLWKNWPCSAGRTVL